MKIAVYCSANNELVMRYAQQTEELGEWIAKEGHTLVFGGTNQGLMEVIARSVKKGGGMVTGVVPSLVEQNGRSSQYMDVEIPTDNLSDRKDLMLQQCDVAIALPGGVGTLDEIFSMAASHCIGYHTKRVVLYNMDGFWDSLVHLLDDLSSKGVMRGDWHDLIGVAESLEEIKTLIS